MRPVFIVIDAPGFNLLSGIMQRDEHLRVQTLVSKPPIETLNHRILHGFAGSDEIQLDAMRVGPGVECFRGKLAAVVYAEEGVISRSSPLECSWPLTLAGGNAYDPQFRVRAESHLRCDRYRQAGS